MFCAYRAHISMAWRRFELLDGCNLSEELVIHSMLGIQLGSGMSSAYACSVHRNPDHIDRK